MELFLLRLFVQSLPIDQKAYWLLKFWWSAHGAFFSRPGVVATLSTLVVASFVFPSVPVGWVAVLCLACLILGIGIGYWLRARNHPDC